MEPLPCVRLTEHGDGHTLRNSKCAFSTYSHVICGHNADEQSCRVFAIADVSAGPGPSATAPLRRSPQSLCSSTPYSAVQRWAVPGSVGQRGAARGTAAKCGAAGTFSETS